MYLTHAEYLARKERAQREAINQEITAKFYAALDSHFVPLIEEAIMPCGKKNKRKPGKKGK